MKTLKEFNIEPEYDEGYMPVDYKTGVACDECGTDMVLVVPGIVIQSFPIMQEVKCPACNYTGFKVVHRYK